MKTLALTLTLLSFGLAKVQAQAIAGDAGQLSQQQVMTNALEEIARTDPEVQTKLASCYDNPVNPQTNAAVSVSECLWANLSAGKKQQITEAMNEFRQESKDVTTGVNLRDYTQQENSTNADALSKLQNFYGNRLEEELGTKDKSFVTNDQSIYFELAKTQLGKNVTTAWSNFCLEAVWGNFGTRNSPDYKLIIPKDPTKRSTARDENLKTLRNINKSDQYVKCVAHIPLLCHEEKGIPKVLKSANPNAPPVDYEGYTARTSDVTEIKNFANGPLNGISQLEEADYKYTKTRACETYAYTDSVRKQLQATEKIADKFNDSMSTEMGQVKLKGQQWQGVALENQQRRDEIVDVERATTITSGDLVNDQNGYYQAVSANEARLAPCLGENGQPIDTNNEDCRRLLASTDDLEKLKQTGATLMLETEAMKEKIKAALQSNDQQAKKEIISQLRPDLAVDELTAAQLDDEFTKIESTYEDERTELVRSLSEQVKQLQEGPTRQVTESNIQNAASALLKRGNEYVQLMHFNNIVTGLLAVEKSTGEVSQNTRVINLELSNVAALDAQSIYSRGAGNNATFFSDQNNQDRDQQLRNNIDIDGTDRSADVTRLKSEDMAKFNDYEITP